MDGLILLKYAAIALAFAGGGLSTWAFVTSRKHVPSPESVRKVKVTYLASYVAMSLSVFALALHGLLT